MGGGCPCRLCRRLVAAACRAAHHLRCAERLRWLVHCRRQRGQQCRLGLPGCCCINGARCKLGAGLLPWATGNGTICGLGGGVQRGATTCGKLDPWPATTTSPWVACRHGLACNGTCLCKGRGCCRLGRDRGGLGRAGLPLLLLLCEGTGCKGSLLDVEGECDSAGQVESGAWRGRKCGAIGKARREAEAPHANYGASTLT